MWEWLGNDERERRTTALGQFLTLSKGWGNDQIFIGTGESLATVWCARYAFLELTEPPESLQSMRQARLEQIRRLWGMYLIFEDPTANSEDLIREATTQDNEDNLLRLARNIALPPEGFIALSTKRQMRVREQIAANPWCPESILVSFARDESKALSARAAGSFGLPSSEFVRLADHGSLRAKATLAANPMSPPDLLAQACDSRSKNVRQGAATNLHLPAELFRRLAYDSSSDVRRAVAVNPATPEDLLAALAGDADEIVRCNVADSGSTPATVLASLAVDTSPLVRASVARNRQTPEDVLLHLSVDSETRVRQHVHENANACDTARVQATLGGI